MGNSDADDIRDNRSLHGRDLGVVLAIFGSAFAVATFVVPEGSALRRGALAAITITGSLAVWRGITAWRRARLDKAFALLALLLSALIVWYAALLVDERDAQIAALERDVADLGSPERTAPGPTQQAQASTPSPTATPPPSDDGSTNGPSGAQLPAFGASEETVRSSGTLTLISRWPQWSERAGRNLQSSINMPPRRLPLAKTNRPGCQRSTGKSSHAGALSASEQMTVGGA